MLHCLIKNQSTNVNIQVIACPFQCPPVMKAAVLFWRDWYLITGGKQHWKRSVPLHHPSLKKDLFFLLANFKNNFSDRHYDITNLTLIVQIVFSFSSIALWKIVIAELQLIHIHMSVYSKQWMHVFSLLMQSAMQELTAPKTLYTLIIAWNN